MSRLWRVAGPLFGLCHLHPVWVGTMRVTSEQAGGRTGGQLNLLPSHPAIVPSLPVLDQRSRGTRFIELSVRSVLNTPASTKMGFWSINPYVGCEFGCTYCYARDTHRWVMERADGRTGGQSDRRTEETSSA